jgi:sugar/nucleoside kinase (ribokinase family)
LDHFDCTVLGDVCVDVNVKVGNGINQLLRGGVKYCKSTRISFGGSGNVAVGLSFLGGKAAFLGKAGNDLLGKLYVGNLRRNGVFARVFFDQTAPTGLVIVYVEKNGERSFLVFRGANDNLSINEIKEAEDLIQGSGYIYLSGYSLVNDPQRGAIVKAFELGKKLKKKIVFDPGAQNLIKLNRTLFVKIAEESDVFSPNLEEAQALTNSKDITDVARKLRKKVPLTVIKCGEKGAIFVSEDKTLKVPSSPVHCLDTTGAGDAFTAALIYGLVHEQNIEIVGQNANRFAAQVTTQLGARSFSPKGKIDQSIKRWNLN